MTRSPRELANQKIQLRKQQEKLLCDLLVVVDALDRASDHWHQSEQTQARSHPTGSRGPSSSTWWQRLFDWLKGLLSGRAASAQSAASQPDSLKDVVTSAREGIDMIRESMLTVLNEHQVVPVPAQGKPFDPTKMHALGQRDDASVPANIVVEEVVRGYCWQDRILREAQVIVAKGADR